MSGPSHCLLDSYRVVCAPCLGVIKSQDFVKVTQYIAKGKQLLQHEDPLRFIAC